MEGRIIYVSRLTRLPLLGADGAEVGRVVDGVVEVGQEGIPGCRSVAESRIRSP